MPSLQNDLVHGWGLDFALRRCVEVGDAKSILQSYARISSIEMDTVHIFQTDCIFVKITCANQLCMCIEIFMYLLLSFH